MRTGSLGWLAALSAAALLLTGCNPAKGSDRPAETVSVIHESASPETESVPVSTEPAATEPEPETLAETLPELPEEEWRAAYRNFLLSDGFRTAGGSENRKGLETCFLLMQLDEDNVPELAVYEPGYHYAVYHFVPESEKEYAHVCKLDDFNSDWIFVCYREHRRMIMNLSNPSVAMNGFITYRFRTYPGFVGSQHPDYDHTMLNYPIFQEDVTFERDSIVEDAVQECYGLRDLGGCEVEFDDDWLAIGSDNGYLINEENILAVLGTPGTDS